MTLCPYWEGCKNLATHGYGGDDYCDEHDVRTAEEATIDRLRSEVARITVDRDALRDHAKACAFSLAEDLAGDEITRLKALLSRARDALEPLVACYEASDVYAGVDPPLISVPINQGEMLIVRRSHARTAHEVAKTIEQALESGYNESGPSATSIAPGRGSTLDEEGQP